MGKKKAATKATAADVVKNITSVKPTGNTEFDLVLQNLRGHIVSLAEVQARCSLFRAAGRAFSSPHACRAADTSASSTARPP